MKRIKPIFLWTLITLVVILLSCNSKKGNETVSESKQEILNAEKAFESCVKDEGIAFAFAKFADEAAVINRNDSFILGKKAIIEFYKTRKTYNSQLKWKAEFVDVSASGDLGYTFGNYTFSVTDSSGQKKVYKGIFHTVWKKQSDGSWKYVWD